jgi:phage tail sheath protein FI
MLGLFRQGAFPGGTSEEAFFVKCDSTTTSEADVANGVVNIVVGFAPVKPADFVILRIPQQAGKKVS